MQVPPRIASLVSWLASTLLAPWETMQLRNQARKDRARGVPPADDGKDAQTRANPGPGEGDPPDLGR
jgi:hypothetical protein